MTHNLPKPGSQDKLFSIPERKPHGEDGWFGWYKTGGIDISQYPVISIDGETGLIDIGGNPDRPGALLLRDENGRVTYLVDGESGRVYQLGDLVLASHAEPVGGGALPNVADSIRLSGQDRTIAILSSAGVVMIQLSADGAIARIGENVVLRGTDGQVEIGGKRDGLLVIRNASQQVTLELDGAGARAVIGNANTPGSAEIAGNNPIQFHGQDASALFGRSVSIHGSDAKVTVGGAGKAGVIDVTDASQRQVLHIAGQDGIIQLKDTSGGESAHLLSKDGSAAFKGQVNVGKLVSDSTAALDIAGQTKSASLEVVNHAGIGSLTVRQQATMESGLSVSGTTTSSKLIVTAPGEGNNAAVQISGQVKTGKLKVDSSAEIPSLVVANTLSVPVGGVCNLSEVNASKAKLSESLNVVGQSTLGKVKASEVDAPALTCQTAVVNKSLTLENANGKIIMDGGDIRLENADCAEDFDVDESQVIEPGTVMVLAQDGKLSRSTLPYDKRVVGIISGAGDYRPGLILDQQRDSQRRRMPIALMGKVFCKVDADTAPIQVGDLLTSSPTPGHAMKASDEQRAFGSIIGKALQSLTSGQGLIPVLVTLQ